MRAKPSVDEAVSIFGATVKAKLSNAAAAGEAEDQLRGPFEVLLRDIAAALGMARAGVTPVGEARVRDLKSRPCSFPRQVPDTQVRESHDLPSPPREMGRRDGNLKGPLRGTDWGPARGVPQ